MCDKEAISDFSNQSTGSSSTFFIMKTFQRKYDIKIRSATHTCITFIKLCKTIEDRLTIMYDYLQLSEGGNISLKPTSSTTERNFVSFFE